MSTLSYSRWIFLVSLAALMFISASGGSPSYRLRCWEACFFHWKQQLLSCVEQKPRYHCRTHGYVVSNQGGQRFCIKGNTPWIRKMIAEGHLHCPPEISP